MVQGWRWCSPPRASSTTGGDDADLVSNRPQTDHFFSAVIQLPTPALLETATPGANGKMTIDPAAAARIAAEQAALVAKLRATSSEIRVLYSYRMVVNAVSILAPIAMRPLIQKLEGVSAIDDARAIAPPSEVAEEASALPRAFPENSVKWIGATRTKEELGLSGRGVRVGVIDTGIDYTHKSMISSARTSTHPRSSRRSESPSRTATPSTSRATVPTSPARSAASVTA